MIREIPDWEEDFKYIGNGPPDCSTSNLRELIRKAGELREWILSPISDELGWEVKVGVLDSNSGLSARHIVRKSLKALIESALSLGMPGVPEPKANKNSALSAINSILDWAKSKDKKPADDNSGSVTPGNIPKGTKIDEDDVPLEFRDEEDPKGTILGTEELNNNPKWDFKGPYLTKHYGPDKTLSTHIKVGRQKVYLFKELAVLRMKKTGKYSKRESDPSPEEIKLRSERIRSERPNPPEEEM